MRQNSLTIIGCGNSNRSDDGVGVFVAQTLKRATPLRPDVRILDAGTAGMEVMFQARGSAELVLIDACRSGSEPGAIFKVPGEEFAPNYEPTFSLHDFRWDHALVAGRKIFGADFPKTVSVYLIEAGDLGLGLEMTAPVRAAAEKVIAEIAEQIRERPAV